MEEIVNTEYKRQQKTAIHNLFSRAVSRRVATAMFSLGLVLKKKKKVLRISSAN